VRDSHSGFFVVFRVDLVLEAWVVLFPKALHMDHGAGFAFTMIFLGGAVLAAADLAVIRWLALRNGVRASSHMKAVLATFGWLMVIPWIGFGLLLGLLTSIRGGSDEALGVIFAVWAAGSLVYDALVVIICQAGLGVLDEHSKVFHPGRRQPVPALDGLSN
jgi:hypothetical protein